jgi:NADH-quinone oxidoreductase subunit E
MGFALTPEREKQVSDLLTRYPETRAAMLPVLWLCQEQHGHISEEVMAYVAQRLDVSTAAVKGVVTFYTMFFDHEVGENVIWVCRTIACDVRGGKAICEHLENKLEIHAGQTTKDKKFTLLKAECLAACGQAPMVQINDKFYENLDTDKVDRILDELRARGTEGSAE